jgi:uncharacterized protein YjbJ (UPF0337 family)
MGNESEDAVPQPPATWENLVVGEAKEVAGRMLKNEELAEAGEEQKEIAHEVHEEYKDEDRP